MPTLQPGDIVIADNHKVAGIQRAIQAAGATLWYVPPYSPDLNPIELCFAKLKALVRTARCRRTETLWPFLGEGWTSALTNAAPMFGTAGTRPPHGHEKRCKSTDRPADHKARVEVENRGKIELPAAADHELRRITDGGRGHEVLTEDIRRDGLRSLSVVRLNRRRTRAASPSACFSRITRLRLTWCP